MFTIISDIGCDFNAAEAKQHGIKIIPFYIIEENGIQKTAQPNPQDYINAMAPHLKAGEDMLILTISSKLSGSYNSAVLAAEMAKENYPKQNIAVVDSLSASVGQGLILREIIAMRSAGYTLQNTTRLAAEVIQSTRVYFTVESLEHLKRGGRISPTKAFVGGLLGMRPILHIHNGAAVHLETVRGKKNIFNRIQSALANVFKNEKENFHLSVGHVQSEEDAVNFTAMLENVLVMTAISPLTQVGTAISAHTGPGALAFACCKKYTACEAACISKAA
jgi:DegV family protein with EDD domain